VMVTAFCSFWLLLYRVIIVTTIKSACVVQSIIWKTVNDLGSKCTEKRCYILCKYFKTVRQGDTKYEFCYCRFLWRQVTRLSCCVKY
jgi:hypothetical protein